MNANVRAAKSCALLGGGGSFPLPGMTAESHGNRAQARLQKKGVIMDPKEGCKVWEALI